jgi:hypothetical protein
MLGFILAAAIGAAIAVATGDVLLSALDVPISPQLAFYAKAFAGGMIGAIVWAAVVRQRV